MGNAASAAAKYQKYSWRSIFVSCGAWGYTLVKKRNWKESEYRRRNSRRISMNNQNMGNINRKYQQSTGNSTVRRRRTMMIGPTREFQQQYRQQPMERYSNRRRRIPRLAVSTAVSMNLLLRSSPTISQVVTQSQSINQSISAVSISTSSSISQYHGQYQQYQSSVSRIE
jgi:hypothetical protein